MNKFPVVEIFESIQGEGCLTGVPSVFIRTSGCNLRCAWKNSVCDSAYTSHNPEKPLWTDPEQIVEEILKVKSPETTHFVFTGGEPMLYQEGMYEVMKLLDERLCSNEGDLWIHFTVETNSTIVPSWDLLGIVDLWSMSPKLESSCCFEGKNISPERAKFHQTMRFNPSALMVYILFGMDVQMKFVWCGEDTMKEIDNFFTRLIKDAEDYFNENKQIVGVDRSFEDFEIAMDCLPVMLMPAGQTNDQINENAKSAVAACITRGWRYCDRTHIRIWGDIRGV